MNVSLLPPTVFFIDIAKIRYYLLNASNPQSAGKASLFLRNGFSNLNPEVLADALFEHTLTGKLQPLVTSNFGVKFIYEGTLTAPRGYMNDIRSVWIVRTGRADGEFVTAHRF